MDNRAPSPEEGRSWKETVRSRLLELPRGCTTRTHRQSYSPSSDTSRYLDYATDHSKDHRYPEHLEIVPLLLGRQSKQRFTRIETFEWTPRNSILSTFRYLCPFTCESRSRGEACNQLVTHVVLFVIDVSFMQLTNLRTHHSYCFRGLLVDSRYVFF